jgi:hypothetical protein
MLLQEIIVNLDYECGKNIYELYSAGTELYDVKLQTHLMKYKKRQG